MAADAMATNPAKGKARQGERGTQGEVRASKAAGRMWTRPVARMTPAAKAFTAKNASLSARSACTDRPAIGMTTPAAPDDRIAATATAFSFSACAAPRPPSDWFLLQLQFPTP
ncbi:hypothetical protein ACMD2_09585 [Ananas comosus]|uniref:Uncharacterized protein n=1 Tax=Ananas comosus TaxID=4615 RepID=A0A199W0U5_ANACO|nr:hypothetical protein ACMD2_09585 [Ananas comosus]